MNLLFDFLGQLEEMAIYRSIFIRFTAELIELLVNLILHEQFRIRKLNRRSVLAYREIDRSIK